MIGHSRYGYRARTARWTHNRPKRRSLQELRSLIKRGRYRLGKHAGMHAISEGFTEPDIGNTILYGRELIRYWEGERLLALGYIAVSKTVKITLHVVV